MSLSLPLTILALFLVIRPVHAFTNNNFHRSTTSRIIGAVIGVVVLLGILVFICAMRRRRARACGPIIGTTGFAPGGTGTGKFGGGFNRWGNHQNQWQNQNQGAYQPSYFPGGPPANANGKYPPGAGEPAPPPYTGANTNQQGGTFSPPPGPPPQQDGYSAPPGPPPAAHVHGDGQQNNNFVGGFRS